MWYENHPAWRKVVIEARPECTKPEWAFKNQYPFLEPDVDFISTFLLERPECDFLRDYRGYKDWWLPPRMVKICLWDHQIWWVLLVNELKLYNKSAPVNSCKRNTTCCGVYLN